MEIVELLSRHKLHCSAGALFCSKCPIFSSKSRDELKYHLAQKHATPRVIITHKCKICFREFSGFFALRQHKTSKHGFQMKSAYFFVTNHLEDDDAIFKEELQARQNFFIESELEKGRHRVVIFAFSTCDNALIKKKWI